MSTKSTILLTEKEHWYHEMIDDNIHIELHDDSLAAHSRYIDDAVWGFTIRGDSELGKELKKLIGAKYRQAKTS